MNRRVIRRNYRRYLHETVVLAVTVALLVVTVDYTGPALDLVNE